MKENNQLSEMDTAEVIQDVSELVFEAALARLLLSLNETELEELEEYLSKEQEPEKLVEYLLEKYPNLQQFMDEEAGVLEEKAKELNS